MTKTIKLLQWNIWVKENPANVIELINDISPDIATLQELTGSVPQFIATSCGFKDFNYHDAQSWQTKNGPYKIGDAIFSKHPSVEKSFSYLHEPKEGSTKYNEEGRVYVESTIDIDGKGLTIGTTHMSYEPWFEDSPVKLKEVENLRKIIETKKDYYVLTGDFNSPPGTKVFKELSSHLKYLGPDLTLNTWTTKPFNSESFSEDKLNWRLDHIFGTDDLKVVSSEIIQTSFSDHLPILTHLEINTEHNL